MSLEEIRNIRLEKLSRLKEVFGSVYPANVNRTHDIGEVLFHFTKLKKQKKKLSIAGRIRSIRTHGGSVFFDLEDSEVRLQCYIKKNTLGERLHELFTDSIDIGDFVGVSGLLFTTKKKEKTLLVTDWWPLAKSVRPLPEKWHVIQNVEERFRKRALDLLMNKESRERFLERTKIIKSLRDSLDGNGFYEVETPILQPLYGGALARPFTTHHHALDMDLYLRVAPELYLKRLMVGNLRRVYEIGKCFRNEGIDVLHSPEFTMLEGYMAFENYESLKVLMEKMIMAAVKEVKKKNSIAFDGKTITFKKPFRTMTFSESIKRYALLPNIEHMNTEELLLVSKQFGVEMNRVYSRGKILDEIFKKVVRKHLIEPTFITNHPIDISPFAKMSGQFPETALRFQLIAGGIELINAYAEINDPIEQRSRLIKQEQMFKEGDEEVSRMDEDYIETLEYGMPPTAGFGLGVDRLVQLLTDTHNIRDVILFPTLKPL